jgi:hypothetical protein
MEANNLAIEWLNQAAIDRPEFGALLSRQAIELIPVENT